MTSVTGRLLDAVTVCVQSTGKSCTLRSSLYRLRPSGGSNQVIPATLKRPGIRPEPQGGSNMANRRGQRTHRTTTGLVLTSPVISDEERIGQRIVPQLNGCWLWRDQENDYGRTVVSGRGTQVHRFVYETLVGPIPEGHDLHHKCETHGCCNPTHLEPLTRKDHLGLHAGMRRADVPR